MTVKSFKNWYDWADWDRDQTFKKVLKSETFQQQKLKTGPNPRDVSVSKKK